MAKINNAHIFLSACPLSSSTTETVKEYIQEVANGHLDDLSAAHMGYFSIADMTAISKLAAEKFCGRVTAAMSRGEAQSLWAEVIRDFHANNNWGFKTIARPEKVVKPPSNYRTGFKYFWAFFNSIVVVKTAVIFIGAEAAENPDPFYKYLLAVAILFSFVNLFWFGYVMYRQEERQRQADALKKSV